MIHAIPLLFEALDGVGHTADGQPAGVTWLAAATWVESRAVEDDSARFSFDGND